MFEVRAELHAIVAATAALACVCALGLTCVPCRARTLEREITTRGIRIRRWRNDPTNVPRHVAHVAGVVQVVREPRRSCPRYIVDRSQVCEGCGEPLAAGKWALFFTPGVIVVKLRLRDGSQAYAQPPRPGVDAIGCAVLAEKESQESSLACYTVTDKCATLTPMDHQAVSKPMYPKQRLAYGWTHQDGELCLVPDELAIRSTILKLFHTGYSYRQIAASLNEAGYIGRDGKPWQAMVVQRVVVKPVPRELLSLLADHTASVPLHAALVGALTPKPVTISKERKAEVERRMARKSVT